MGVEVYGVIPYKAQLTYFTLDFLAEKLLARVLAGEDNLKNVVKNIIIGKPLTAEQTLSVKPSLHEGNHLIITGGDKGDLILAALERDTAGIIITNDIVPHQNIIARANERGIPILLVGMDTFKTAKTIDDMEALLRKDDSEKIQLLSELIEKYARVEDFLK
jgi:BioD-like phosphotransacetylase family protein